MNSNKLPEPKFYTLETILGRLGLNQDQVLNFILTDELKASVQSDGWWIESGHIIRLGKSSLELNPQSTEWFSGKILTLFASSVKELFLKGEIVNPPFQTSPEKYLCCSSNHYPSATYPDGVVIKKHDLIFTKEHVGELERRKNSDMGPNYEDQFSSFSDLPKPLKSLQTDFLRDVMPIWSKFYKEHKNVPTKKATVKLLLAKYPEKYSRYKPSSLERFINLKDLNTEFHQYNSSKD